MRPLMAQDQRSAESRTDMQDKYGVDCNSIHYIHTNSKETTEVVA